MISDSRPIWLVFYILTSQNSRFQSVQVLMLSGRSRVVPSHPFLNFRVVNARSVVVLGFACCWTKTHQPMVQSVSWKSTLNSGGGLEIAQYIDCTSTPVLRPERGRSKSKCARYEKALCCAVGSAVALSRFRTVQTHTVSVGVSLTEF